MVADVEAAAMAVAVEVVAMAETVDMEADAEVAADMVADRVMPTEVFTKETHLFRFRRCVSYPILIFDQNIHLK